MQTEPIITTNNMSVDDVAAWITEKAQALHKLQSLRTERERAIRDHERALDRFDEDIINVGRALRFNSTTAVTAAYLNNCVKSKRPHNNNHAIPLAAVHTTVQSTTRPPFFTNISPPA